MKNKAGRAYSCGHEVWRLRIAGATINANQSTLEQVGKAGEKVAVTLSDTSNLLKGGACVVGIVSVETFQPEGLVLAASMLETSATISTASTLIKWGLMQLKNNMVRLQSKAQLMELERLAAI